MSIGKEDVLVDYVDSPERYWGVGHRQAKKLMKARDRMEAYLGGLDRLHEWLRASNAVRSFLTVRTLLIFNAGSSGSHWLQSMLQGLIGLPGAGEVYLPDGLQNKAREDFSLIDGIQLIQGGVNKVEQLGGPIINTSHSSRMLKILFGSGFCKTVFLVRNPVDIVLSRTFRKSEYRQYKSPHATDEEYVAANIEFVKRVFAAAEMTRFDLVVHYEDLRSDSVDSLREICQIVGISVPENRIRQVAEKYRAENVMTHMRSGNLYEGKRVDPPSKILDLIVGELEEIMTFYGYHVG